jgi:hypothetical protein
MDVLGGYTTSRGIVAADLSRPGATAEAGYGASWLAGCASAYSDFLAELAPERPGVFTWIDDRGLNAFADLWRGTSVIGINLGVAEVMLDFFSAALCCPAILPSVGESDAEIVYWEVLPIKPTGVRSPDGVVPRRIPQDPMRQDVALVLTQLAIEFTFLHELSHVAGGHVHFKRARLGLRSPIRARPVAPKPSVHLDTLRLLEFDADYYAVQLIATHLLGDGTSVTPVLDLRPAPDLHLLVCLALNAYFALMSPEAFGKEYRARTHPDPSLRLMFVLDGAESVLPVEERPRFRAAYFDAFNVMHDIWTELGVERERPSDSYLSFMGKAVEIADEHRWLFEQHERMSRLIEAYDMRGRF